MPGLVWITLGLTIIVYIILFILSYDANIFSRYYLKNELPELIRNTLIAGIIIFVVCLIVGNIIDMVILNNPDAATDK